MNNKYLGYIAVSKDNFICDENGSVNFLDKYNEIKEISGDYIDFMKDIDVVISGSTTYKQYLTEMNPYENKEVIILSSTLNGDKNFDYKFFNGNVKEIDNMFKDKTIWVMGGDKVIKQFIDNKMLNEVITHVTEEDLKKGTMLLDGYKYEVRKSSSIGGMTKEYRVY